ncbi:MAG TPA: aldose 1-epimerase family protein [Solirubrobacteraceae bacterium]|nr:aldose 1-epimerase family protein [Solirubrobacteraceae bacterium]
MGPRAERPRQPILPSGEQIAIEHGDQRVVVVEVGGGLRSYSSGGRELLDGYGKHEMCSAGRGQILAPWPNRLRDGAYELDGRSHRLPLTEPERGNAIHGLVRWAPWRIAVRERERVRLELLLHPQPGYPFTLALAVEYALGPEGLSVAMSAANVGSERCPFGIGAHPYLALGAPLIDSCLLRAPGQRRLITDQRGIPTGVEAVDQTAYDFRSPRQIGPARLDTAYTDLLRDEDGMARVQLIAAAGGATLTLWQDRSFPYLMLFSGDTVAQPERRRRGLAVEPMSCAPNAFQSGAGLAVLEPGESFRGRWGIDPGRSEPQRG